MEHLNQVLFLLINAAPNPSPLAVLPAMFFASYAIWLVPVVLTAGWLGGAEDLRKISLQAAGAGLVGLLLSLVIGQLWPHPRPFMIGLGQTLLSHVADASFPSDHLTLLWSVAFSLSYHRSTRSLGLALALLGLPVAWARIYLGVHFPFDMLGALAVSWLSARLCHRAQHLLFDVCYPRALQTYRTACAPFIRHGWLRL